MADLTIKRNDTLPILTATLEDQAGPIDLTDALQVRVLLKTDAVLITGVCTIADAPAGEITYTWDAVDDTATAGTYQGEFEITWPDGVETIPNDTYFELLIIEDLG